LRERAGKQAPHGASLRSKIPRLDRATDSDGFEEVVGVLIERPDTASGTPLLQAARIAGAMTMLRRSGLELVLLPSGTEVSVGPIDRRRPWWRRPVKEER
jgi:hypothetical protein